MIIRPEAMLEIEAYGLCWQ